MGQSAYTSIDMTMIISVNYFILATLKAISMGIVVLHYSDIREREDSEGRDDEGEEDDGSRMMGWW